MRLAIPLLAALASTAQIVDVGYARYQGFIDPASDNTNFLGIRYADSVAGTFRWTAPRVPTPMDGIVQAITSPVTKRATNIALAEDCLYLNVFTPGNLSQNTELLPVVVWIHGGGYMSGSASGVTGNDLIREAGGGVVAVTIQYRLGVLGFLPGTKVKEGGVLNAGLLDQEFALQWVQQHISKFGGDPTRVTIWGESAGSVIQHVIARGGKTTPPLFRGAMMSSAFLPSQYQFDDVIPEKIFDLVSTQTSCSSAADTLACLRAVDITVLQFVNTDLANSDFYGTFMFVPVIDGTFITQRASQAFANRQINSNAALAVSSTFEGDAFINLNPSAINTLQIPNYISQLFPLFGAQEVAAATAQYQGMGAPIDQATAIMSESIFTCPTYLMLRAFGQNAFKGEFAVPSLGRDQDTYYFPGIFAPPFNNPDFDKAFSNSFLNFVLSLDPNVRLPYDYPAVESVEQHHGDVI
ncbi:alpha beta-hydrolase [Infundibulicybe gibba]|nr:alpha beta-hydrolase [Infundibulicybe gibba]